MKRISPGMFRTLLLAAALLFAQHAAMLHGLAHAEHEIAAQDGKALGHGAEVCAAFAGIAQALSGVVSDLFHSSVEAEARSVSLAVAPSTPRAGFLSRAPPYSA